MTLQTITLARPLVLPQNPDCDCCGEHLVEALRGRAGVADAALDAARLVLRVDTDVVARAEAEVLACDAGASVARRYDHPVFAVEGMDCADCAQTLERALARLQGVHYATVNFAAAKVRLEYDRQETSIAGIVALGRRLGYLLQQSQAASVFVCSVDGMCCAAESGPIEHAVRALPGVQQVTTDPALARLTVTYDPQSLAAPQIVGQVERLGFRVTTDDRRPTTDDHSHAAAPTWQLSSIVYRLSSIARSRPKDLTTVLCGLLIAAAWASGPLGAPPSVALALYTLATLAGGWFVARSGWATLLTTRTLDINLLMVVAAIGALLIGEAAEAAAVVFLFALGNALEGYTMDRARRSIRALMRLAPDMALVLRASTENGHPQGQPGTGADRDTSGSQLSILGPREEVALPVAQVRVGETIVIQPGDRVPLDALVLAGESAVDQAPITGESVPVAKAAGAELFAGSINGAGALEARVTRPAQDSTLARIIHMVEEAQARKSRAQRFIDVFAKYYTPAVIAFAALVAVLPPLLAGGGWLDWLYRALVLLVIACPCALVISTPVSVVSAISAAARAGVLFKGGAALEAAGGLKALAFDKTGTLTLGRPAITDIIAFEQQDSSILLQLAAAVERRSTHPLARAIVQAAEERGLPIPRAADFRSIAGHGANATVDGRTVTIGNRAMFAADPLPPEVEAAIDALERSGHTAMLLAYDGAIQGLLGAADQTRAESRATIATLKRHGIAHIAMLTGDAAGVAERVGRAVEVDETRAELLPDGKLAAIDELLAKHGSVGMIGDGINDAPALARATVGIAMGAAGSDAALETADVTLMADDLTRLPFAIGLSRQAHRVIIQNIAFALAVKAVFLVATLLGAATLWMAVFADTGAALIVIANGMRLLRARPEA
jgi:Cd2+/Zn2+-exporting ATPase